MRMTSVAVICAYFGKLPPSFGVWMRSCEFNSTIDFILFTDQQIDNAPRNVHVISKEFSEVQELADRKMQRHVALEYPYKLCDLKPMYGIIFDDFISEYNYWGHCDMDMVFGDIRYFLEKYNLEKYDKFLNLGHLSLYKNNDDNNRRFMLSGSKCGTWEKVISHSDGFAFDETNGIYQIYLVNKYPVFDKRIFADISMIYQRFRLALNDTNYDHQVFYWKNGKVYRDYWSEGERRVEEFIYIHFKKRKFSYPEFDAMTTTSFYICPTGFHEKVEVSDISIVSKMNPFKGALHEKAELLQFDVKDFIGRVKRKLKRSVSL